VSKNKLAKFADNKQFRHVIEPDITDLLTTDYYLKGNWNKEVFGNNNPIVLELGCGKGEYAVNLAKTYPEKNFIGIDIKGARIWRGAKTVEEEKLSNICFLRTRIELLHRFFAKNEVSEIWITFPDPQRKKRRRKKRLTYPAFLNMYNDFLMDEGVVHLKTDSLFLHKYTNSVLETNKITPIQVTNDLYNSDLYTNELKIKTHYEALYLEGNPTITYIKFQLQNAPLKDTETDDEAFLT